MKEMVGGCCVCSDERGWPDNPLVYCDGNGCTVAVHQACYGIVTVPTGPWFCRKCESPEKQGRVRCELCPSKSGALKRADTGGWAHVVCALYIPEVRFGNVTSMEPIVLRLIPAERFNKTCYICQDLGKHHRATAGACMQCNKSGCKQQFHVTCAQSLGLLCEEAGNYLDNVKYCGYCQHHYSKLKKGGNVKTIPPYKPVSHDSQSSDSSGEKEGDASPVASGSGTPTHSFKSKGPGRKSSHSIAAAKSLPSTSKTPTSTVTSIEKFKKSSPLRDGARRGSSAADVASVSDSSKTNTPAPSPQHTASTRDPSPHTSQTKGDSTPGGSAKATALSSSPTSKPSQEPVGVISSVATATAAAASTSTIVTPSVVQSTNLVKPATLYQESVITNAELAETKQTKKRKALSAANTPTAPTDYTAPPPALVNEGSSQYSGNMWENSSHVAAGQIENMALDKTIKKAKTEAQEGLGVTHFAGILPAPPPPPPPPPLPPAHSPSHRSPRHLASPNVMAGPSGSGSMSNIRSPNRMQMLNATSDNIGAAHILHQMHKQAAMEHAIAGHSPHGMSSRTTWGGLNVSYEMQQPDPSTLHKANKDMTRAGSNAMTGTNIRTKKRAAMTAHANATATATMLSPAESAPIAPPLKRPPQPTPPPLYHETIKDSPPSSPGSERSIKTKLESITAPHMLGNELNPESGAAARLQEQLNAELAAHAAGQAISPALLPPPLINKATSGVTRSSSSSSGAQSLDQLLERQWEQGSQFLMEQAQHFDIASLLSCLHQLRTENVRLEEHVGNLLQRRDHLLAVNARLAIPLTTVNAAPQEPSRCSRDSGPHIRPAGSVVRAETITAERSHQLMMRELQQKPS